MVLVDVTTTSLFYDRNCPKDIVLPMEGHVLVARNKPNTALDCVDTPSVSSWWRHGIITVTRKWRWPFSFQNLVWGVLNCDGIWGRDEIQSPEVGGKEAERGD